MCVVWNNEPISSPSYIIIQYMCICIYIYYVCIYNIHLLLHDARWYRRRLYPDTCVLYSKSIRIHNIIHTLWTEPPRATILRIIIIIVVHYSVLLLLLCVVVAVVLSLSVFFFFLSSRVRFLVFLARLQCNFCPLPPHSPNTPPPSLCSFLHTHAYIHIHTYIFVVCICIKNTTTSPQYILYAYLLKRI